MKVKNRNTKREKRVIKKRLKIAVFIVLFIGIISAVFQYFKFVSATVYEESVSHLTEVFHQSDNMLRELINKNLTYLHMWGENLQNTSSEDEICDYIEKAQEDAGFLEFYFLSTGGNYKMVTGETGYLGLQEDIEEDIRQGNDVITNAAVPGKSQLLVFATPKAHGNYQGFEYDAIAIAYENSDIVDVLDISAFNGNAQSFVVHPDGRVVVDHSSESWGNVYNFFGLLREHSDMSEKEINKLLEKFKAGCTDAMMVNLDGRNYYLVYEKSDIQDWIFLGLVQADIVNASMNSLQRSTMLLVSMVVFCIAAFLISLIIQKGRTNLGRNYVETSNYIERVFPFFHVRFLAVTDDFDSFREGVDLTVPLKNIINEFYSKDLAKKSSSAKKALWKKGKFTSAWEPYGYRKSEEDHHQLIVDEEAAEHLKRIFSMYMDGRNYSDIARQLNKDGVLSPTLQRKFYKTGEKPLPESKPWNNYEVKRVLQDVHCTGDSVFGKYQQSVFQGNKQRNRPESEWVHVENTHEGIIDRELFQQVQSKIQEYTEVYKKKHQQNNGAIRNHNFYTGKIWCGGCGNRMTLSRERNGTFFYICGANTNHKSGGKQCKGHRVRKEYVDDDVLRLIQTHMKTVLDIEKMIQEMNAASKNQTQYLLLDKEVGKLRRELSRISKRKSDLYEDYSERLITEEEYIQFSRIYSNEIENIKSRLDTVLAAQVRYSQDYHIEEGWGNVIHTYMSKRKLTKEMADAFVDSIIIRGKYDYEIKLVYDDQFADLQKLKKEKEAQSR